MQTVQLPDEFKGVETLQNNLFVFLNGQLLLDSAFEGMPRGSDYDLAPGMLTFNRKTGPRDVLQLICPVLKARWLYVHDDSGWKPKGKFEYRG